MVSSRLLLVFSVLVLAVFIVGCGEQAGEAGRFLKPGARSKGDSKVGGLQPVADGSPTAGQDIGVADEQEDGGSGLQQDSPAAPEFSISGGNQGSLGDAQMVATHAVEGLHVSSNRFGNVVWQWSWPDDCVFPGQAGFRYADVYIDSELKARLDCKSDPAQYTEKFSAGESHTIKIITVMLDGSGVETRGIPGVSDTAVVE